MAGVLHERRSSITGKRPHLKELRVSACITHKQRQEYFFSEGGSFNEGNIHIGKNGVSIQSSPKSPNVAEYLATENLEIFEDKVLGQGAYGIVKLAYYKPNNKMVAVKKVPLILEPMIRKKVLQELTTLYQSDHPNIVSFVGGFLQDGAINLVLEYMDGGTIAQCIKTRKIPEFVLGKMASMLLPALVYVHKELNIVHRDIKPSNILVDSLGNVKLSDFGVSGKLQGTFGMATTFTGTVTYMSPERIRGDKHSSSSDVWSFGLSLLECAMGHYPFLPPGQNNSGITFFDLLAKIREFQEYKTPAGYSDEFTSFIRLCLNHDPTQRPSASELYKHSWIQRFVDEPQIHLRRWIHQTLKMQKKTFSCTPELCGDCSGAYQPPLERMNSCVNLYQHTTV